MSGATSGERDALQGQLSSSYTQRVDVLYARNVTLWNAFLTLFSYRLPVASGTVIDVSIHDSFILSVWPNEDSSEIDDVIRLGTTIVYCSVPGQGLRVVPLQPNLAPSYECFRGSSIRRIRHLPTIRLHCFPQPNAKS